MRPLGTEVVSRVGDRGVGPTPTRLKDDLPAGRIRPQAHWAAQKQVGE